MKKLLTLMFLSLSLSVFGQHWSFWWQFGQMEIHKDIPVPTISVSESNQSSVFSIKPNLPTNYPWVPLYRIKVNTSPSFSNKDCFYFKCSFTNAFTNLSLFVYPPSAKVYVQSQAYFGNGYSSDFSTGVVTVAKNVAPPNLAISIDSYLTNWYNPPLVVTNRRGKVTTTYFSAYPLTYRVAPTTDYLVMTNWSIQVKNDLLKTNWTTVCKGTNSLAYCVISNIQGNAFFRLAMGGNL